MVRDFTVLAFRTLIKRFADAGYSFQSCREYHNSPLERVVILRHDVDRHPGNSLATAEIEHEAGISGTYYFRTVNGGFEEEIIQQISQLGHEIGYHYEDLRLARQKTKDERQKIPDRRTAKPKDLLDREEEMAAMAIAGFRGNLAKLRETASVDTICMHGSPLSPADSRRLWKYYDYSTMGIIAEPYFDFSLEGLLYLTDTGRRWDGSSVSIRDRVYTRDEGYFAGWKRTPLPGSAMFMTEKSTALQKQYGFRKTEDILQAISSGNLPERLMVTFHPQRWNDNTIPWLTEYILQNFKNAIKYFMIRRI
jgi:hypothetical protein